MLFPSLLPLTNEVLMQIEKLAMWKPTNRIITIDCINGDVVKAEKSKNMAEIHESHIS